MRIRIIIINNDNNHYYFMSDMVLELFCVNKIVFMIIIIIF